MAYFITASTSASVTQTTFDTTGSIVTSSLFTPNDPLNVDNITTIKKSRSPYPSLNRSIYKESVSFTNCDGTSINWLYDTTASRDNDFNIIKALNTNYESSGGGGGSWVGTATSDLNMATYDIYNVTHITASGNISASGDLSIAGFPSVSASLAAGGGGGFTPSLSTDLPARNITASANISASGTIYSELIHLTNTTTGDSLTIETTEDSSTAAPVICLKRNSSSPGDGDYLGQIKFLGENDAGQQVTYAKITGKTSDVTDTTEDGLLEFAVRKAGSNSINARLTHSDLKLINGTGLEVAGDIQTDSNISASGYVSASSFSGDGSGLTNLQRPISLSVSSHMTASNDNAGFFFEVGAVTCSIQAKTSVTCDVGSEFEFFQSSSGNFIFVTGSGVTLRSKGGALTLTGQYSGATLKKIRDDEWILVGDLA